MLPIQYIIAGIRPRSHNWQAPPTEAQSTRKAEKEGMAVSKANKNRAKSN